MAKKTRMIGSYKMIGAPLGTGGMATVYKVQDEAGNFFAAKVLHAHFSRDRKVLNRFKKEYEIGEKLKSDAFVEMYELFKDDGAWVIVMELVDGITLQRAITKAVPFGEKGATSITAELLRICHQFHAHNMVHRDLKPDNIMLTRKGKIKLMDYGVARVENSQMTNSGTAIGTPVYMAPEQLHNSKGVDARCDLYSIALIYYRLITRRDPHGLRNNCQIGELLKARETKAVREIKALEEVTIQEILNNALHLDPKKRYKDCAQMAKALKALASYKKISTSQVKKYLAEAELKKQAPAKAKSAAAKQKKTAIYHSEEKSGIPLKLLLVGVFFFTLCVVGLSTYVVGPEKLINSVKSLLK